MHVPSDSKIFTDLVMVIYLFLQNLFIDQLGNLLPSNKEHFLLVSEKNIGWDF